MLKQIGVISLNALTGIDGFGTVVFVTEPGCLCVGLNALTGIDGFGTNSFVFVCVWCYVWS